jgi:hypothetical protein
VELLDRILTVVLGPRCEHGCGLRVYTNDRDRTEHRQKYCQAARVGERR